MVVAVAVLSDFLGSIIVAISKSLSMVEVNVVEAPVALLAAQLANSFGCKSLYVEGDYLIIILATNKARVIFYFFFILLVICSNHWRHS